MKFERNKRSKNIFLYGLICVVVLTITITFITSRANYRVTASYPLANGTVKATPYDFNIISMYISDDSKNYNETTVMPTGNYVINEDNSYCYIGSKDNIDNEAKLYTNSNGEHIISNLIKGDKCILYFDKTFTMQELLANYYIDKRVRTPENKDFNVPFGETTTKTIFSAPDDNGTSYYFAGNPTDNWVEFGGYYWRIIRVNGDKSIRMIYQGRTKDKNGNKLEAQATGEETQIGTSAFNTDYNDNKYVGYFYEQDQVHGTKEPSTIYTFLNNWFKNDSGLKEEQYFNKIDLNAGFCNDRTSYVNINGTTLGGGTNTTLTYYGAFTRLKPDKNDPNKDNLPVKPTFGCANEKDLFKYSKSSINNDKLDNPVGLITADEISYAGMVINSTAPVENYLHTNQEYWTISPATMGNDAIARMFRIWRTGYIGYFQAYTNVTVGVRPVINLRSDVKFTGNGTESNPYKVI